MRPRQRATRPNHRATQVANAWSGAPGPSSTSLGRAFRVALKDRTSNEDMARSCDAFCAAQQSHQFVSGLFAAGRGARVSRLAGFVDFARGNARETDTWTLRTPDRAVAIPNADRSAGERGSSSNDLGEQQQDHGCPLLSTNSGLGQSGRQASFRERQSSVIRDRPTTLDLRQTTMFCRSHASNSSIG